jgi:hypothetical protein
MSTRRSDVTGVYGAMSAVLTKPVARPSVAGSDARSTFSV